MEDMETFMVGDRVIMVRMSGDPDPIPSGTRGIVRYRNNVELGPEPHARFEQVAVDWDNGRSLMVCIPPDELRLAWPTRSYWCHRCKVWTESVGTVHSAERTYWCKICGDDILCDECGTVWTDTHDCVQSETTS